MLDQVQKHLLCHIFYATAARDLRAHASTLSLDATTHLVYLYGTN